MRCPPSRRSLRSLIVALGVFAFLIVAVPAASAHQTPGDIRAPAGCNTLVKPAKREACKKCVTRPKPHHFHPKRAAGNRCAPNNGKP